MDYPVFALDASTYTTMNEHHVIYNINELNTELLIHMDDTYARGYNISGVQHISSNNEPWSLAEVTRIVRDNICWFRVPTVLLNTEIGHHVYKLTLTNESSLQYFRYISYTIQNSNPEKPYVYMNRNTETVVPSDDDTDMEEADELHT